MTYVSMQFCSVRPDSMAIFKSVDFGRTWTAFQFYSSDCWHVYGRSPRAVVTRSNEQQALCTDVYSTGDKVAAPRGSRIAFSTLEGRPSAHDFDHSPILQVGHTQSAPRLCGFLSQNRKRLIWRKLRATSAVLDVTALEKLGHIIIACRCA